MRSAPCLLLQSPPLPAQASTRSLTVETVIAPDPREILGVNSRKELADVTSMPKHFGKKIKKYHYLPLLDDENRFFWTSGADGRLRFLRCQACGYYLHPPLPRCPTCGSGDGLTYPADSGAKRIDYLYALGGVLVIGGSLARAVRSQKLVGQVVGYDRRQSESEQADRPPVKPEFFPGSIP